MAQPEGQGAVGVILAAGASRRLGRPKQTLKLREQTLLNLAIEQLAGLVGECYVVVGARAAEIVQSVHGHRVHFIENDQWQEGMASSIRAAVQEVCDKSEAILFAACDQPFVRKSHYRAILDAWYAAPESRIATDYGDGTVGVPALFPQADFDELLRLEGDRGAKTLLIQSVKVVNPSAALDIDTQADYAAAAALPAERGS